MINPNTSLSNEMKAYLGYTSRKILTHSRSVSCLDAVDYTIQYFFVVVSHCKNTFWGTAWVLVAAQEVLSGQLSGEGNYDFQNAKHHKCQHLI